MNNKWATRVLNYTNKFPWRVRRCIYESIGLIFRGGQNAFPMDASLLQSMQLEAGVYE